MELELYQVSSIIKEQLEQAVDMETGEIVNEEAFNLFTKYQEHKDELAIDYANYYKNIAKKIEMIKLARDEMKRKQDLLQVYADRIKKVLSDNIGQDEKIDNGITKISKRKSTAVEVEDLTKLNEKFVKTKIEQSADKEKIKKAIKDGEEVEGATLVEHYNIQIQ